MRRIAATFAVLALAIAAFFAVPGNSASATALLVGRSTLAQNPLDPQGQVDTNPQGSAEAFEYTAIAGGTADTLELYVASSNAASTIKLGLYTNSSGDPGSLVASGTISSVTDGAWNTVTISGTSITNGGHYWLAFLSTSGTLAFLDDVTGGLDTTQSQVDSNTSLTSLPSTWSSGNTYTTHLASVWAGAS